MAVFKEDLNNKGYRVIKLDLDGDAIPSPALINSINTACDDADMAERKGYVMIRVEGQAVTEQQHLWQFLCEADIQLITRWERALRRLEQLQLPTIITLRGYCNALALELLLAADYRLAYSDLMLSTGYSQHVMWPGMHVFRLTNAIGVARARRLLFSTQHVSAGAAADIGLVDSLVSNEQQVSAQCEWACDSATAGLPIMRRLIIDAPSMTFEDALGAHLAACDKMLRNARQATCLDNTSSHVGRRHGDQDDS